MLSAAREAGIYIYNPCGGEGTCGRCKVLINKKEVLACRTFCEGRMEVEIPPESQLEAMEILYDDAVRPKKGKAKYKDLGVSIDIGTTTIVVYLVDLTHKEVLGAKAAPNPQVAFGEDVITRIMFAERKDGLKKLHQVLVELINNLIVGLAEELDVSLNDITNIVAAGNTTMIHLLLRADPTWIRKEHYESVKDHFPEIKAVEAGIKINPQGLLATIPAVASYVGGDITAGVLASGIDKSAQLSLFIDLGTNGEVVLGNKEWLVCCSTSAGPCFEGGGIKWGVRAMAGAIQKVEIIKGKVKAETIKGKKARGICGSGIVSLIGEMFRTGIINKRGEIQNGEEFKVVDNIVVTQAEIKNVIRSKGAIYHGAKTLLRSVDLNFDQLDRIIIAGGMGTSLEIDKAILIGLLPDLPLDKFSFIGNSAISGAKMCLLSREDEKRAKEIAQKMTYVDLSTSPDFMNDYTASLFLPHTDINLFPSVKKTMAAKTCLAGRQAQRRKGE